MLNAIISILMVLIVLVFILSPLIVTIAVIFLRKSSPDRTGIEFHYVSFGTRLVADLLDGIAALLIALPFWFLIDHLLFQKDITVLLCESKQLGISNLILFLVALYNMTYLVGKYGQSWGRKYKKIRVVDYAGEPIGFWKAFFRNIIAFALSTCLFFLGYLWVLWDSERQAWHDKIIKTYVIHIEPDE